MKSSNPYYLDAANAPEVEALLRKVLALALKFKNRRRVSRHYPIARFLKEYVVALPEDGRPAPELVGLIDGLLRESINWSSPMFMGFNDSGNSVAALMGGLVEATCQQNLINSDFCARAATFVEVATVRWLRELVGYANTPSPRDVRDLGGVATTGGTCSNMYGLLMARKNAYPDSFRAGLPRRARPRILIPADITHYSVAAAAGLVGFGAQSVLKVPTKDFRSDLGALDRTLKGCLSRGEEPVCVVANAGDSRTLTMDDLEGVAEIVKRLAPACWLHFDACNGGQLLFSKRYRDRIRGIAAADSVALDPHKVFNIPYALSYFLFKDPGQAQGFWASSSLIMRDPWALGQLTPNIGSKSWSALKLYLLIRHLGRKNLCDIVDRRIDLALRLRDLLRRDGRFRLVTARCDGNAVAFVYVGRAGSAPPDPEEVFRINERIYARMLEDGSCYVHGFPIKDDGDCLGRGRSRMLFALRYMSSHPSAGEAQLRLLIRTLARLGEAAARQIRRGRRKHGAC